MHLDLGLLPLPHVRAGAMWACVQLCFPCFSFPHRSRKPGTLVAVSGVLLLSTTAASLAVWQLAPAAIRLLGTGLPTDTANLAASQLQMMVPVIIIAGEDSLGEGGGQTANALPRS